MTSIIACSQFTLPIQQTSVHSSLYNYSNDEHILKAKDIFGLQRMPSFILLHHYKTLFIQCLTAEQSATKQCLMTANLVN